MTVQVEVPKMDQISDLRSLRSVKEQNRFFHFRFFEEWFWNEIEMIENENCVFVLGNLLSESNSR